MKRPGNELWPDLLVTLCLLCLDTFYTETDCLENGGHDGGGDRDEHDPTKK